MTAGKTSTSRTTGKPGSTTTGTALSKRWQTQRALLVTERLGEAAAPSSITIGMDSSIWSLRIMRTSTLHTPLLLANILPAYGKALLSFADHGVCLAAETRSIAILARAASKTLRFPHTLTARWAITVSAFHPLILTTTAGPISTCPATAHRASSTATIATEPSRTWVFSREWPTTSTVANRQAWAPRLQITMAMEIWIFSARTSPTTLRRFLTTISTALLPT